MGVQGEFDLQRVQQRWPLAESSQIPFERFRHKEDQHWPHGTARITPLPRRRDISARPWKWKDQRSQSQEGQRPEDPLLFSRTPLCDHKTLPVTLFFHTCRIPLCIYDRPYTFWNSPLCSDPLPLGRPEIRRSVRRRRRRRRQRRRARKERIVSVGTYRYPVNDEIQRSHSTQLYISRSRPRTEIDRTT